jgi:hypothetical protein
MAKSILNFKVTNFRRKIAIVVLFIFAIPFNLIVVDRYLIPCRSIYDNVISVEKVMQYAGGKFGRYKILRGYMYTTEKGYVFLTNGDYIGSTKVNIERTQIFNNIVSVSSEIGNEKELLTGLGGVNGFFYLIMALSSSISIAILSSKIQMSDMAFLKILLLNGFLLFVLLIIWSMI